jgi:LuxR family transcriptional regulator, maltose regulon positive regulatory protein
VRAWADGGEGMTRIPFVADGVLQVAAAGEAPGVVVGSPAWFAWVADDSARSFSFRSPAGVYTARKERRQRGAAYWVAYRTAAGRQYKRYLGTVADLTPEHLAEAAAALAERITDATATGSYSARGSSGSPGRLAQNAAGLLLETKLYVPRPRRDLVPRARLHARLKEGLEDARCSLLSAPAGAGKTSLLATWVASLDRPVAWLALDERDQEAYQVLRYLIASLQTIAPECGRTALALLDAPPMASPEIVLTGLLNDLAAMPAPALLVLDDYHLIREPAVHTAIEFLLNHLPPTLHLVIATREDPPLPLPRLRASGQIVEVRAAGLSFNVEEAAAFLGAGMGLRLTEQHVAALVERTEGWAAGLQLAGLALRDRTDPTAFVDAFTGSHRLVADYLMAEVLERQPAPVRRFLLVTSVLDRLCAPLCDALLAADLDSPDASSPAISSQQVLEELEASNLFLVPLDDDRIWYRYHHLFADALRGRLTREAGPAAAALLHRQASVWFGRQGLLPEAIGHALAADAVDDAATWIEALMPSMFATMGIHQVLADWLSALPEPVVRSRPLLCLTHAWLLIHRVELQTAAAWVEAAAQALPAADNDAARQARGAIAATRAYMATVGLAEVPKNVDVLAEQAIADLAPDDATFRGVAYMSLGQAALALGQLDRAENAFTEAAMVSRAGLVHGAVTAVTQQVSVQRLRGAHRRALTTGWATLAWTGEHYNPPSLRRLRSVMADLLVDENDVPAALPLAVEGLRALREYGNPPPLVLLASLPLARLRVAEGDTAAAEAVLADVRPLIEGPFAVLAPLLDAAEAHVRLAVGEAARSVDWAVAVDPAALPGPLRFGVPGLEATVVTPLRILVAHGRATADAALLQEAERRLDAAWQLAERQGIGWLRLRLHIAQSLIAEARGDQDAALRSLAAAVAEAELEGVTRPFLDEGAPMAALLAALSATSRNRHGPAVGTSPDYLDALLAAFSGQPPPPPDTSVRTTAVVTGVHPRVLAEPLSVRELDVLRLLSGGRSNAEIARDLFVEQSTVKTHLIHIYRKLGVSSRTQAISRARTLRLLD